jgi:hypothetical protein
MLVGVWVQKKGKKVVAHRATIFHPFFLTISLYVPVILTIIENYDFQ